MSVVLTTFRVTHPFHPLLGQEFELAERRVSWGVDWVHYHGDGGRLLAVQTRWTDLATPDPFVTIAQGRVLMRTADLQAARPARPTRGRDGDSCVELGQEKVGEREFTHTRHRWALGAPS